MALRASQKGLPSGQEHAIPIPQLPPGITTLVFKATPICVPARMPPPSLNVVVEAGEDLPVPVEQSESVRLLEVLHWKGGGSAA